MSWNEYWNLHIRTNLTFLFGMFGHEKECQEVRLLQHTKGIMDKLSAVFPLIVSEEEIVFSGGNVSPVCDAVKIFPYVAKSILSDKDRLSKKTREKDGVITAVMIIDELYLYLLRFFKINNIINFFVKVHQN